MKQSKQKEVIRRQYLYSVANGLKMVFSETDDWGLQSYLEDFHLFRKGKRRTISNVLYQVDAWHETNLSIFDYSYVANNKKNSRQYKQTVFFIRSKRLGLPEFYMQPEHFFHRIGALLGFEDIDFKEHPEFSNRYHLKGEDEEWVREAFDQNVIRFFNVERDWCAEGVGYYLVLYKKGVQFTPKGIVNLYKRGLELCEMMAFNEEDLKL